MTFLDGLSEIGGLGGFLYSGILLILKLINDRWFVDKVIRNIYRTRSKGFSREKKGNIEKGNDNIPRALTGNILCSI